MLQKHELVKWYLEFGTSFQHFPLRKASLYNPQFYRPCHLLPGHVLPHSSPTHTPTLPVSDEQVHIITEGGSGIIWKRTKTLLRHCVLGMPGSRSWVGKRGSIFGVKGHDTNRGRERETKRWRPGEETSLFSLPLHPACSSAKGFLDLISAPAPHTHCTFLKSLVRACHGHRTTSS